MTIRNRQSTPADLPGIFRLWQETFGDTEAAVAEFFRSFPACRSFVAEEAGRVVSMVHALPQTLSPDLPAAYLYAVATARSHRGRGLCRDLMAFAEGELQKAGFAACVLTPSEESLFGFYEAMGYEAAFYRSKNPFPGGTPISLQEYMTLREELLSAPHMVYDEITLDYARRIYGLTFYKTADGIAAAGEGYTAEVLPRDLTGGPYAMIKWLQTPQTLPKAYLGFALE